MITDADDFDASDFSFVFNPEKYSNPRQQAYKDSLEECLPFTYSANTRGEIFVEFGLPLELKNRQSASFL